MGAKWKMSSKFIWFGNASTLTQRLGPALLQFVTVKNTLKDAVIIRKQAKSNKPYGESPLHWHIHNFAQIWQKSQQGR
jgi:hypothetical protein